ncbi:MAG: dolichyl-phosphate beta-glucosyltransferase [Acidimicrobiales bacterium]
MGAVDDGNGATVRALPAPDALRLTLVVPAFNETDRLADGIARLTEAVDAGAIDPASTELLVVDDGSTDGTGESARRLLAPMPWSRVLRLDQNTGKGAAVRTGIAQARGAVVAFTDADMAIDPMQAPRFVEALAGADVAIGSRVIPGARADAGDTLRRKLMGIAFNLVARRVTGVPTGDTQCGFKAFRTPAARLLFHFGTVDRFAFDVEILHLAHRLGMSIREVPVRWRHAGRSRIRPGDPLSMLADVARIRLSSGGPPVEALEFGAADDGGPATASVVRAAVGPTLPVAELEGGGALLLLPLCSPEQVRQLSTRLGAALRTTPCRRRALGVAQLAALGLGGLGGPAPEPATPTADSDGVAAHAEAAPRAGARPARTARSVLGTMK